MCDCGRDAPPAVATSIPSLIAASPVMLVDIVTSGEAQQAAPVSRVERPPAPPPNIFLVDCAFLI
jgi:hypothetical protein